MKSIVIWPKSENVVHINYHYTQFGEIVDYLDKKIPNGIIPVDYDVTNTNIMELIEKEESKKVAMNVNYENVINAFSLAKEIKQQFQDTSILAYGSLPKMLPDLFSNSYFDAIFKDGDFETCIESFFKGDVNENKGLDGMYLVKDGKLQKTSKGRYIQKDEWGISRIERVPVKEYDAKKGKNRYVINVSRGCPFGCPHCLIQLTEGRKERRRSIENLDRAIDEIKDKYKHIKIWAANFTLDKKYVNEFCEIMKRKHPNVTWECATRIDLIKDKKMLQHMYEAGCKQISLGIESLNNSELIHTKDFKVTEIFRAIKDIQEAGIQVKGCIMLGMPNQTKESIVNTIKFLIENNVIIRPTIYTPYHELGENVDLAMLSKYNRKTFENYNVPGVSPEQLLELVKEPYNYEEILRLKKTREDDYDTKMEDVSFRDRIELPKKLSKYGKMENAGNQLKMDSKKSIEER